ncbi:unnamed protein product [Alternaria alternata]
MSNVNGVITAIPPPDGYEVNFANPQRRLLTEAYVIFTVENILALMFLGQRLYTKVRLMKQFQIDDAFVILGWACSVGTQGILITGFSTGSMGVHAWEILIENIIESNLFVICCCLPTLRRFLKHVAPRLIGESRSSENKDSSDRNHGLRTWGSENTGPKRKYDTLMRTVDGTTQGDGDDEIPLASVPNKAGFRDRERKVPIGNVEMKGDNDSEEAILYERTVQVTYDGGAGGDPANPYTRQVWAGGQHNPTNL